MAFVGRKKELDSRIIKFISENPDYLDGKALRREDMGLEKSPDRRAWERLSQIIKDYQDASDTIFKKICAGIIGMQAATKFYSELSANKLLSAKDILTGDFKKLQPKIKSYETSNLAVINESLFRYLEVCKDDDATKVKIAKNLEAYFDLLVDEKKQEALGHFSNLFIVKTYPNAIMFIICKAPKLQDKLINFVVSL